MWILRAVAIIAHRRGCVLSPPTKRRRSRRRKKSRGTEPPGCLRLLRPFSLHASSKESIILRRFDGIPARKSRAAEDLSLIYGARYLVASWAASDVEETISYIPIHPSTHLRSTIALRVGCITIRFRARCTRAGKAFAPSPSRASVTLLTLSRQNLGTFKSRAGSHRSRREVRSRERKPRLFWPRVIDLRETSDSISGFIVLLAYVTPSSSSSS